MKTVLFYNNKRYLESKYKREEEFEKTIVKNSKTFFGKNSIVIEAKKKISTKNLGGTIPDLFLIELSDHKNPEFYLVEVELSSHDFFRHIFPQITKFFAFFKDPSSMNELIEKLYTIINSDEKLKGEILERIKKREIYKFLKDMLENSQNILLILDDNKKELPEIIETYTDTWGKMVKTTIIKEFKNNNESIFHVSPDFENIETIDIVESENEDDTKKTFNEDFHLNGVNEEVKNIYYYIKEKISAEIPGVKFNSQHYYISIRKKRNFAYIKLRKKRLGIVVMDDEKNVRNRIKNHTLKTLSNSIQNYYNGPCCEIIIEKNKNLEEIIQLLIDIQK
jgi:predicted transport protein